MNNQEKTKDELIEELQQLQKELSTLKSSYHKDILDRKSANKFFSDAEEKYKVITESTTDLISIVDLKGKFIYASPSYKLFGYEPEQLIGKDGFDLLHPDDKKNLLPMFKQVIAGFFGIGESRHIQIRIRAKTGIYHYADSIAKLIKDESGKLQILSVVRDITAQKNIEEKLKESEEKYKALFTDAPLPYQSLNEDGNFIDVNPAWLIALGYKKEEIIGRKFSDFLTSNSVDLFKSHFSNFKNKGEICHVEFDMFKKNGSIIKIRFDGRISYDKNGNFKQTHCIFADITEQKKAEAKLQKSEEKLRSILNSMSDLVFVLDEENRFVSYFVPTEDLFVQADDFVGKTLSEVMPKHISDLYMNALPEIKLGKTTEYEYDLKISDGVKWYSAKLSPMFENGKYAGLTSVIRDITEHKLAEQKLSESENLLNASQKLTKVGGWKFNVKNQTMFWTKETYRIHEIDPNDIESGSTEHVERSVKCYNEKDHQIILDAFHKCANSGISYDLEFPFTTVKGNRIWIRTTAKPEIENNKLVGVIGNIMDITERKQAEEKIQKEKQKAQQYLNIADVILVSIDSTGIVKLVNLKGCEVLGYSEEEIMGQNWFDTFLPERLRKNVKEISKKVFAGEMESIKYFENKILTKSGNERLIAWHNTVLRDTEGKIIGTLSSGEDITERKQMEEELRESENKFRLVANYTFDWEYWIDTNGDYKYISPSCERITGYSSAELTLNPSILFEIIRPDSKEKIHAHYHDENNRNSPVFTTQFPIINRNGEEVWIEHNCSPIFDEDDNYLGRRGNNRDITLSKIAEDAVRESEERYRALFINNPVDTIFVDKSGKIIAFNDAKKRVGGRIPAIGKDLYTEYAGKHKTNMRAELMRCIKTGESKIFPELEYGDVRKFLSITIAPFNQGAIITSENITGRKKAEQDLIKALEKATESDQLKSAFLSNMSHEIRTPMNGILGFSSLLKEPNLSGEKQQEYINIIEKSGARMLNTINDIIDISRIESGQVQTTISKVNVNEQIEFLYAFFKPEAVKKGIHLTFKKGLSTQEAIVKSDAVKINSILTNLIKNAIKYTHDGTIEFGYILKQVTEGGISEIEFYIKDTGIGIPKDRLQAIFNRFEQADIEDKQVYEGSGLGLAISKAYVKMLGGKIWVESEEGVGSKFYFTIPYNTNNKEITRNKTESSAKQIPKIKMLKILLVDDEEFAIEFLHAVLDKYKEEILIAKTGVKAIELCRNNPDIDLILMDIKMPEMNGYEATRQIRKFNKDMIIIAQTANALRGDKEKAIEAGCNDYISKPIKKDLLIEMIQKYFS